MTTTITTRELNILCASLLAIMRVSPKRGKVYMIRCPDLVMRKISTDEIVELIDRLSVLNGSGEGVHANLGRMIAKEIAHREQLEKGQAF